MQSDRIQIAASPCGGAVNILLSVHLVDAEVSWLEFSPYQTRPAVFLVLFPRDFLKHFMDPFEGAPLNITNLSLQTGTFPAACKNTSGEAPPEKKNNSMVPDT